ncbi:MAG: cysteine synthase family protein [Candidatus Melainabacteria bacterium]|nr:cysteine synthase family protein [Candidatus Melainabacteria bacterium]
MNVSDSIASLVGNTPVVRLSHFAEGAKFNLFGKCEFLNPGGSVKDRIGFHMVKKAVESGALRPGGTIVEATAGNTGIGLALAANLYGFKLITVMSQKVSKDKVKLLEALNSETVITASGKAWGDPEHFMSRAKAIAKERGAWLADQFYNQNNIEVHYETTGPEIWEQMDGKVDVFVAGVGTGGTLTGVGRYLKERNPAVKIVLADPCGSLLAAMYEGKTGTSASYLVEGIGQDFVPGNFDISLVDGAIQVSDEESVRAAKKVLRTEAMFVGSSSGCILHAAVTYAQSLPGDGKNVVAILPDGGRGYLSTIYNPDWLSEKLPLADQQAE